MNIVTPESEDLSLFDEDKLKSLLSWLPKHSRVMLFIDAANTYMAARAMTFDIDWSKLLNLFNERCELICGWYFTALPPKGEYSHTTPLVDWLEYNGYRVVSKEQKEFTDADGNTRIKGNMDVELTIYMLNAAIKQDVDYAILFSGDGDFRALVAECQKLSNMKVVVVSARNIRPPFVADELRRQADIYIDLSDIEPFVKIEPRNKGSKYRRGNYEQRKPNDETLQNEPRLVSEPRLVETA
jgi:uncharacterized LabA/DUF88 family protein